ncbi:hypothetical protein [Heyndrickxia oleronia]|jgi:hypothetical protein|uniref:hypothetical protein n=1 Tax=Heyndrickxia oleronia TaxID=38875 RepID=UPI00242DA07C|nr:hypothetical protein [Heyndrickxia oleronia]MCI1590398.1 hypothetical protein [Heyndrickxia oleronia]MCI1611340.1 hypothetical protein [Heyndrickxia oleronia]MCI1742783.1 hypothetical protein [Heyndrickxia oleronia]MCI1763132.1 hypothetical protein [Heyndrickxia oleronia]
MANGLDKEKVEKQKIVHVYSLDTSCFYTDDEASLNNDILENGNDIKEAERILNRIQRYKDNLKKIDQLHTDALSINKELENKKHLLSLSLEEVEHKKLTKQIKKMEHALLKLQENEAKCNGKEFFIKSDDEENPYNIKDMDKTGTLTEYEENLLQYIKDKKERSKELKKDLDELIADYDMKKNGIRKLRYDSLYNQKRKKNSDEIITERKLSNIISLFQSTLTRSLTIDEESNMTTDIIIVRAFRYKVFETLVIDGFENHLGEHYQYFASTAGQIRNKKSIFIKSTVYKKIANKLTCGLSIKDINEKGSMNLNKFNVYTALCNTSSVPWTDFDIRKSIVVPDFITTIENAEVDVIDGETYEVYPDKVPVEINHCDGAGMYLPTVGEENKSFQFRMPFFKGLLCPMPYDKFIEKFGGNPIVKDIYNDDHDVIKEGIKYIFTESQFKMSRFWESWEDYQDAFEEHGCEAAKCKEESDAFEDKTLNYQVIQSLNEMERHELEDLSARTVDDINKAGNDLSTMLRILGADDDNLEKYPYQEAINIYPNLVNDPYFREMIKENRKSLIKDAKAGKILLEGSKRTYIAPDLFAFCERLFLGKDVPNGLLKDGEVSCQLYEKDEKLDVLRSPHNFREHCLRTNKTGSVVKLYGKDVNINDWFITNDIFTSTHDLCSKQLMFDVDGDDALIVSSPLFCSIAERHMVGIKPLEYKLEKATESIISNKNIYDGLIAAYSKAPMIGNLANEICKIWNSGKVDKEELDLIRILCFESNAYIDYAKTLWLPKRPPHIDEQLKKYSRKKTPYFFKYAKDKKDKQVEAKVQKRIVEGNKEEEFISVVNMLDDIIPKNNIHFEDVIEDYDYRKLICNENNEIDRVVIELYETLDRDKNKVIKEQLKKMEKKRRKIELMVYKDIREQLLEVNGNINEVVDSLVKYLYFEKNSKHKQTLWHCFGEEILKNIKLNVKSDDFKACGDCGDVIERTKAKKYCAKCAKRRKNESNKNWKKSNKENCRKNKAS